MHIATIIGLIALAVFFWWTSEMKAPAPSSRVEQISGLAPEAGQETTDETPSTSAQGLVTLDLSGQGLRNVPSYVFDRTRTEFLDLSNNELTGALQAEVRHLRNLKILDLSDNNFTGVPAEIGQLTELERLDLSNNDLTGLPYELGNLSNLKVLDISGNDYSEADLEIIRKGLSVSTSIRTK